MEDNQNHDSKDVGELEKTEQKRRVRALIGGALVAFGLVGGFIFVASNRDLFFEPKLDIESGEENVIEITNDPQCRGLIADVTQIGRDFATLEPELEKKLLVAQVDETRTLHEQIGKLKNRAANAKGEIQNSTLRFDESRTELQKWFKHLDLELRFLEILAEERLSELDPSGDKKIEEEEGTVVVDKRKKEKEKTQKTPEQRLEGALLATTEAFESFRVWHTGGFHPCGAADEGETPWVDPTAKETKPKKEANK